jgi:hypothetical protein
MFEVIILYIRLLIYQVVGVLDCCCTILLQLQPVVDLSLPVRYMLLLLYQFDCCCTILLITVPTCCFFYLYVAASVPFWLFDFYSTRLFLYLILSVTNSFCNIILLYHFWCCCNAVTDCAVPDVCWNISTVAVQDFCRTILFCTSLYLY